MFQQYIIYHINCICQVNSIKILFRYQSHPLTKRAKRTKGQGKSVLYWNCDLCCHALGVAQRLEFTFTLPQGSCHQLSEPSVSHDRAWMLIAHCYQTVAPDIKIRLLSQHSPSLLLFPSFLTLIMPCYE